MFSLQRLITGLLVNRYTTACYFKVNALWNVGYNKMHTKPTVFDYPEFSVEVLPANSDNFMYLVMDKATREALVVDPVDPEMVLNSASTRSVNVSRVLTTHHHWDHAGGNSAFVARCPNVDVVGGDDRIEALTTKVAHGETFKFGPNLQVQCLGTPCHTSGHVCYYLCGGDPRSRAVFTGDTLFIGGCGRFFEGTAAQMHAALNGVLSELPGNTAVFCGHEYTLANLKFALHAEPENAVIRSKEEWAVKQRAMLLPTVPSSIEEEKRINPFMRVEQRTVQEHTRTPGDPFATMAALRAEKNHFKA